MFAVYFEKTLIGYCALEKGDPPMAIALGDFTPTDGYSTFKPRMRKENGILLLNGDFDVYLADGTKLPAKDAYLEEADFGEEGIEYLFCVLGVDDYETHFPGYWEEHEAYWKSQQASSKDA